VDPSPVCPARTLAAVDAAPEMLALPASGFDAFPDEAGLNHDQHALAMPQLLDHVTAQVIAYFTSIHRTLFKSRRI
jgi:hypothetical protein